MTRAPFIVIEGLDRSGKTTQASLLQARLEREGVPSKLLKFPDRTTTIGQMIDSYLKSTSELDDHAIHLLFSANRWEMASTIETLLNEGTTIICDRYAFSGIAFSASKVVTSSSSSPFLSSSSSTSPSHSPPTGTTTPKLPFEWCRAPDIGLPAPDLVLFLDIAPDQARLRGGYGEERYEKEEMQARVREVFGRLGDETSQASNRAGEREREKGTQWMIIDAGKERDAVSEEMWSHVEPLVKNGGLEGPVGRLWSDRVL